MMPVDGVAGVVSPAPARGAFVVTKEVQPTADSVPDFPTVYLESGLSVYQEALIEGQYLVAHCSAMGRPKPRWWIWDDSNGPEREYVFHGSRPPRSRQTAFQLEVDGVLLADGWVWVGSETRDLAGARELRVRLRHERTAVQVDVVSKVADTGIFERHLVVENVGDVPVSLTRVCPWSGLVWEVGHRASAPDLLNPRGWDDVELSRLGKAPFALGKFTNSEPGTEGSFDWMPLPDGWYAYESMRGRSGWGAPYGVVRNEATGEMLVVTLAWSGNWRIALYNDHEPGRRPVEDARCYLQVQVAGPAPLRVLAPGESASTAPVHFGFLFGDLDDATQMLHRHIRRRVVPPQPAGRENRVEVNHTAFTRVRQVTEEQLLDEVHLAADLGAELFMIDAGWFGGEFERWYDTVGDWEHESPLLSRGLNSIFDEVRSRGMLAGLWVEAERMGPASDLLRRHPDWQMNRRGHPIPNLDLSRPEVSQYVETKLVEIIDRYQLDCFRLDYNHNIGEGGETERFGRTESVLWRYYDALYGIFERIRARYPNLLLENCSSGGGRMDLGMLSRFHWTQLSDRAAPLPSLRILNGSSLLLPPELCMPIPGGSSRGVSDLDFLVRLCLFGHFAVNGLFPNRARVNTEGFERWRHGIDLYKEVVRPLFPNSRLFHHTPVQRPTDPGDWLVLELAADDRMRAIAGVFRLLSAKEDAYRLRFRGLDRGGRYRVRMDSGGEGWRCAGTELIDRGVLIDLPSALRSELVIVEAE